MNAGANVEPVLGGPPLSPDDPEHVKLIEALRWWGIVADHVSASDVGFGAPGTPASSSLRRRLTRLIERLRGRPPQPRHGHVCVSKQQ
jgi:hypothetical protein